MNKFYVKKKGPDPIKGRGQAPLRKYKLEID